MILGYHSEKESLQGVLEFNNFDQLIIQLYRSVLKCWSNQCNFDWIEPFAIMKKYFIFWNKDNKILPEILGVVN